MAISKRGVMGQRKILPGCTEEDIRQDRKKLNQSEPRRVQKFKSVPSKVC